MSEKTGVPAASLIMCIFMGPKEALCFDVPLKQWNFSREPMAKAYMCPNLQWPTLSLEVDFCIQILAFLLNWCEQVISIFSSIKWR